MQLKTFCYIAAAIGTVTLYSCSGNNVQDKKLSKEDSIKAALEAFKKPNSDYKPAFKGQTRIDSVTTATPYKVEKLAEHLGRPWAIVPMPDGKILMTDRSGFMQLLDADGKVLLKITGFPKVADTGQGGLLDVAPDPAFLK